jgi:hypothetical protein
MQKDLAHIVKNNCLFSNPTFTIVTQNDVKKPMVDPLKTRDFMPFIFRKNFERTVTANIESGRLLNIRIFKSVTKKPAKKPKFTTSMMLDIETAMKNDIKNMEAKFLYFMFIAKTKNRIDNLRN